VLSQFDGVPTGEEVEEQVAPTEERAAPEQSESGSGLIRAEELPRASEALAELFPEEAAGDAVESTSAPRDDNTADGEWGLEGRLARTKRRGVFSWLFRAKDSKKEQKAAQKSIDELPLSDSANVENSPAAESTAPKAIAPVAIVAEEPKGLEQLAPTDEPPVAAERPTEILPIEEKTAKPLAEISSREERVEEPLAETPSTTAAITRPVQNAKASEEIEKTETQTAKASTENFDEVLANKLTAETSAQVADLSAGIMETVKQTSGGEVNRAEQAVASGNDSGSGDEAAPAPVRDEEPRQAPYRDWALDDKLASHREWVESHGHSGNRADLSGSELEAADLISVNLRMADLHDANMRAADMLLADLRDACLVRADLEESCLVGANLEGANLEGATLETAMGLVPRQLAGANLRDAVLAPQLMEFEAATKFARNARLAYRYFVAMSAASLLSWLLIGKTSDVQLVSDSAVLPFLHSRAAASTLPTAESYLIIPVALFICYLVFHFHLQQLWDAVHELPAIFPDGHELGEDQPSIILGLLRTHFRWMNPDPSSTRLVERALVLISAYAVVPITLFLFWARYLTRQEIHGTLLQALLTAVATGVAIHASTKVGRPTERWELLSKWSYKLATKVRAISPLKTAGILGAILLFLSAGTIAGVPHDRSRAPQYNVVSIRRWAPSVFALLGYNPYADLTEKSVSRRPSSWNVADDQVGSVDGARLNGAKLRYAQGYGVFLANAHLLNSNLQGAFLSQADLRGADLGQSNLRFAIMDQSKMRGVNLDRSTLSGTDLRRADLRGANLSHSKLQDAILTDARLDGASLYGSHLDNVILNRANLEKADMRETFLARAHMDHADLQGAYLWSAVLTGADLGGAQFGGAILIDANLQGANLGGAQLSTAVLNNTALAGTSLDGADLRGALGLTSAQVCSAKSRRGAKMDDSLALEVQAQCGTQ
jgi:uncharacterized protein YjbI with pentapeptide repeats